MKRIVGLLLTLCLICALAACDQAPNRQQDIPTVIVEDDPKPQEEDKISGTIVERLEALDRVVDVAQLENKKPTCTTPSIK